MTVAADRIPTAAAQSLGREHRRTRWLRLLLAAGLAAALAACFAVARGLDVLPTSYFAESTGGVLVLDLSTSVDAQKAQRAHRVLQSFAESEGRVGLVVFSDTAYEMFPPDTRSEELRPLLRFFETRAGRPQRGDRRPRGPEVRPIESPWSLSFRGGTKISTGLAEARRIVEREGDRGMSVLLLSDLDNSGFDTSDLTEELNRYQRADLDLRVVPLFPVAEDRELFEQLVGKEALVERIELVRNTSVVERQTLVGAFPWALVGAALAVLALVALQERLFGRLRWGRAA